MSRRPAPRREAGQGTLEFVGIVFVAAVLVMMVITATTGTTVQAVSQRVGCEIRSIATQSGSCGSDVPPTAYDPNGTAPDQPGASGDGVGSEPPGKVDGGKVDGGEGGGGVRYGADPAGWDNADGGAAESYDQDNVDDGHDTFEDKLDGGWNGVGGGELGDIENMLDGLTGPELDAVIAGMSDEELKHWIDELDDGWVGSGWSRERRRELWSMIAAKASADTMERIGEFTDEVQPSFAEVGGDDASDDGDSPVDNAEYTEVPHELFVDGVDPHDLTQGQIGDCWLIASMAALANTSPDAITDLIQANPNGTYTVTLYDDGKAVDVTVTPDIPTVDGDPLFADNATHGDVYELWPQILEKAAAQYYGDYTDIEGDWPSKALELYTGSHIDTYTDDWFGFDDVDPPSLDTVSDTLDDGGAVLVSTASDNRNELYENDTIVQGHAYYVLDVTDDGTVLLANPWGLDSYPPIEMTYEQFESSFIRYDFANPGK